MLSPGLCSIPDGVSAPMSVNPLVVSSMPCMILSASGESGAPNSPKVLMFNCPLPVLLNAWPEIHRRTGARLRVVGADPLAVRLLLSRHRVPEDGIDMLGFLSQEDLTAELLRTKVLAAPSIGMESFGMVLTRAFACAVPVVSSDIDGYRDVMTDETGLLVPPGDPAALAEAVVSLLEDEQLRQRLGNAARTVA